jgi:hypothetical protein
VSLESERARWNGARYLPGSRDGHYESWFQRANHPSRPLAFWIRYTIFVPRDAPDGAPGAALAELWAIFFDGEAQRVIAVKEEHPIARASFSRDALAVTIVEAQLDAESLTGSASRAGHSISWSLRYASDHVPLLLLPERLYAGSFPRAKALVGAPLARFDGTLEVDGTRHQIDGWTGSQNHNWGSEHTARYAWAQVAGFDDAPDAFLEVSTARVRIAGPLLLPKATPLVLRLDREELRVTAIARTLMARAEHAPFSWTFSTSDRDTRISGTITAPEWSFVALPYPDPPGGTKTCLNSKIARCDLIVERRGRPTRTLHTAHRAAFELVSNDPAPPGIAALPG